MDDAFFNKIIPNNFSLGNLGNLLQMRTSPFQLLLLFLLLFLHLLLGSLYTEPELNGDVGLVCK